MTGTYCSSCGAEGAPGASFCAHCGAPVAAAPPTAPPGPQPPPGYAASQPPVPPLYPGQQPYTDETGQFPAPQTPYPYGGPPQQPWGAFPSAGQPGAVPWGTAPVAGPAAPGAGRTALDALLTGDWGGAARTAGIAVGAMLGVSLVGMLFLTDGGIGFRETLALVLAGACLAVGGDAYAEAGAEAFGAKFSVGLLPLTVTLVGLGLMSWLFARQVRRHGTTGTAEVLLHGARTALVFTVIFLPLSLLTRYKADSGTTAIGLSGRLGVGVVSTVLGGLLFAVLVLGLTTLLHPSTTLPGRLGAFRAKGLAPLGGAAAVFSVGVLAVIGGLVYGLIEADNRLAVLGAAVLGGGNGALASVLWSAGVPLHVDGSASATPLGQFTPGGADVTLFTFTDQSAWFWLAPVLLLATMLLVATALAVRQNTIEDARREGFRFAGALAFVAFVAALLLRIGFDGGGGASQFDNFQAAASGSLMFNPLLAAFVLAIWGVLTGLLAPVVAAKVPASFVVTVRRRFGSAPAAPMPEPPAY